MGHWERTGMLNGGGSW